MGIKSNVDSNDRTCSDLRQEEVILENENNVDLNDIICSDLKCSVSK